LEDGHDDLILTKIASFVAPLQSLHVECSTLPMILISVDSQPDAVILTIELISLILLIQ